MTTDSIPATQACVEEMLRRLGAGDFDGVAALYSDGVDWRLNWPEGPQSESVPWIRNRTTRANVSEHFATIASHNRPSGEGTVIEGIVVSGADAFVTGTIRNQSVLTGAHYAARFALHLRVVDGLITQHHVYEDSLAVHSACSVDSRDAHEPVADSSRHPAPA